MTEGAVVAAKKLDASEWRASAHTNVGRCRRDGGWCCGVFALSDRDNGDRCNAIFGFAHADDSVYDL